jgi:hypothetical protein
MRAYGSGQGWQCRFRSFNNQSLDGIAAFYRAHDKVVNRWSQKTQTFDFQTGKRTKYNYTKAKIVDMIGFQANGRIVESYGRG